MNNDESNRAFWEEFILLYKSFPNLWDVKSKSYLNRNLRNATLNKLVEKCKEIYPTANKDYVKRKIQNFRCCIRREIKKISNSKRAGASKDDVHVPNLWYYDLFDFITELEIPKNDEEIAENEADSNYNVSIDDDRFNAQYLDNTIDETINPNVQTNSARRKNTENKTETLLTLAKNILSDYVSPNNGIEDKFDVAGKKVACELREMSSFQSIICRKMITDALYYGRFGWLNENTTLNLNTRSKTSQCNLNQE